MESCSVNLANIIICSNLPEGECAFLSNENIDDGRIAKLKSALEKESDPYLQMLVHNKAGSAFRSCKRHEIIAKTAQEVLNSRKS
jgi:hypothetical protein